MHIIKIENPLHQPSVTPEKEPAQLSEPEIFFNDSERQAVVSGGVRLGIDSFLDRHFNSRSEGPGNKCDNVAENILQSFDAGQVMIVDDDRGAVDGSKRQRLLHNSYQIASAAWLAEVATNDPIGSDAQPKGKRSLIGRFLDQMATTDGRAALGRFRAEIESDPESIIFSGHAVIDTDTRDNRLRHIFGLTLPEKPPLVSSHPDSTLSGELRKYAVYTVRELAEKSILRRRHSYADEVRNYVCGVLGYDMRKSDAQSRTTGDLVAAAVNEAGDPSEFVNQHLLGLQELAWLDRERIANPEANTLYENRVATFLRYMAELRNTRISAPSNTLENVIQQLREQKLQHLTQLGGNSDLAPVVKVVAREIRSNEHLPNDTIAAIIDGVTAEMSRAHNHGRREYDKCVENIEQLLVEQGVLIDDGVLTRILDIPQD